MLQKFTYFIEFESSFLSSDNSSVICVSSFTVVASDGESANSLILDLFGGSDIFEGATLILVESL